MFVGLFSILTCLSSSALEITASLHGPVSRRIVRGFEVDIKSFPHAVFLYFNVRRPSTCGSTLISIQAIVTSAHCIQELSANEGEIHAFLGASKPMYSTVVRNVTAFIIHPKYDPSRGKFDLSVAKFNEKVAMSQGIQNIPIFRNHVKLNDEVFTAGWGKKWPNVIPDIGSARTLAASKQRIVSMSECSNMAGIQNSPAFLCTLPIKGFHYRGDLGNGLVTRKPFLALVGVVSLMVKDATLYADLINQRYWVYDSVRALYGRDEAVYDCC